MNKKESPAVRTTHPDLMAFELTALFLVLLLAAPPAMAQHELLDRIVAVVDGSIITLSDIRTERLMHEILAEPSADTDREILDELIDQRLIQAQAKRYGGKEPAEAEVEDRFKNIKDWKGLAPETIRRSIRDHLRVEHFLAETLGIAAGANDWEIQRYYDEIFVPAATSNGLFPIPPLAAVKENIRRKVTQKKMTAEVNHWLQYMRTAAKIEILDRQP
jgi:hypothetical protein